MDRQIGEPDQEEELILASPHFAQALPFAALLLTLIYAVKFQGWGMPPLPGLEDYGWVWLFEFSLYFLPISRAAAAIGAAAGVIAFLSLWLDAVLFRVFTIELGPGGLGTAVTSALYRELVEMASARRFFKQHLAFGLLPCAALLFHWDLWFGSARLALASSVLLGSYGLWVLISEPAVRTVGFVLLGTWLALRFEGIGMPALPLVGCALWVAALSVRKPRSRLIRPFFSPRRLPRHAGFAPRPEDAVLLGIQPLPPTPSSFHGLLRGENVAIWTIESMARDYLSVFSPGSARTPYLETLLKTGLSSQNHFCLCPLTNNFHTLLYASQYTHGNGFAPIQALQRAGYQTVYLTSCDTRAYGLKEILCRAGFESILDATTLRSGRRDPVSDKHLCTSGINHLASVLNRARPFFLHVHTSNTHVPYRVEDPKKFRRFEGRTDLGRFLNGLEEADATLSEFVTGLKKLVDSSLLVVSADHGQSFGQFGYHSHGSAVVKEQLMVPCAYSHPLLPQKQIEYSTHLDVLPTVLDLLGIGDYQALGASILGERPQPRWLLWAGHPSRSRTSHFGLINGRRKIMVDFAVDRAWEMGWNDELSRELVANDKAYYGALISELAARLKVE